MPKLKLLKKHHKRAMELKYKGKTYEDVADILNEEFGKSAVKEGFNENTLKHWFREGGTLVVPYREYADEMDNINREIIEDIKRAGIRIRGENFRTANEMLVALMASENDSVKLGAIKELLDREEGKAKQRTEVEIKETIEDYAHRYYKNKHKEG